MKRILFGILSLLFVLGLSACSSTSDDKGATATADPNEGKSFTGQVTAAAGGTVKTDGDTAKVTIPAGALPADVEVTIDVQPADAETETSVYDFGPDGTVFNSPVTITIAYDGKPGADEKAVLAWKDGDNWVEIAGSKVVGGNVVGDTTHFTKFSVIIVGDKVVVTSECADVVKDFAACGGDIKGTWTIKDLCIASTVIGDNPYEEMCQGASYEFSIDWVGEMVIDATTITQNLQSQASEVTLKLPMSCPVLRQGCSSAMFGEDMTCGESDSFCVCTHSEIDTNTDPADVMQYTIEGNNIVVDEGEGTTSTSPYCRTGNLVYVKIQMGDGEDKVQEGVIVLEKK